jgi:rhodanese-related sulfurtransferase
MSPESTPPGIELEPAQLAEMMARGGVQVLDVREQTERDAGHISGSSHVPLLELAGSAGTLERERPVVAYCRVGSRSEMAAQALRAAGFEAYSMAGGLVRWTQEGRPLSPEGGRVADH